MWNWANFTPFLSFDRPAQTEGLFFPTDITLEELAGIFVNDRKEHRIAGFR
jgi:hypothetical protein